MFDSLAFMYANPTVLNRLREVQQARMAAAQPAAPQTQPEPWWRTYGGNMQSAPIGGPIKPFSLYPSGVASPSMMFSHPLLWQQLRSRLQQPSGEPTAGWPNVTTSAVNPMVQRSSGFVNAARGFGREYF